VLQDTADQLPYLLLNACLNGIVLGERTSNGFFSVVTGQVQLIKDLQRQHPPLVPQGRALFGTHLVTG
jgi:hypothetical protein